MEVTLAVLADYALISQEGKLNILGVFEQINPQAVPFTYPRMFLVVTYEASPAEIGTQKTMRITLLDEDGSEVLAMEGPLAVPPPARPGARSFVNQVLDLQMINFHRAGSHAFHILVNGEDKRTVSLHINEPPQGGSS